MPERSAAPATGLDGLAGPPDYARRAVSAVFTSAAAVVGVPGFDDTLGLPAATRVCVFMVDGMGHDQLTRRSAHAPVLRALLAGDRGAATRVIDAAFPSTTAASLAALGTGLAPGQHGLVGYDVLDPDRDVVVNMLGGWDPAIDPARWQPHATVFERASAHVPVTTVSQARFEHSGMTRAALRGARFLPASSLHAATAAATEALAPAGPHLLYLYANDLDKAGHRHGVDSVAWEHALEEVDGAVGRLLARLPRGTLLMITADHGMVDVDEAHRIDVSADPALMAGIRHTAGEPRLLQLYLAPGAEPAEVVTRWRERFGRVAWVTDRRSLIDAGHLGPVDPAVAPRIGDVLVLAREPVAFYDRSRVGENPLRMVGQHGSWTPAERRVPLITVVAPGPQVKNSGGTGRRRG
ncbi:alkaline phosphatase family protein [Tersicoccus solisilvae]|uniref:Alkaline phosphatase family protein n=1 Tax=Tersicoccus solisilvae TaxID=1882339 RepID=A0ABQ1PM19_9MICC|nr:nucleotide pyrophosphatase/phosphodiesterase family protein [Tersicoccus solisilvae]GGC99445.1 alkaline phosphatase family protein [Tersicoccus solisilvae]